MPRRADRHDEGQRGQASPEYVGAVLLVAALFAGLLALAGPALPGGGLTRAIASKIVCAVKGSGGCGDAASALAAHPTPTERAYGPEIAAILAAQTPTISFEPDDFVSLPVDYRDCRERACADSILHGSIEHTQAGLEPTVFTHVVDCRDVAAAAADGYDCTGERAGHVYIQYWLYYPDSLTHGLGHLPKGYHLDDWESYQVRVDIGGGAVARASSHHGYNGRSGGLGSAATDAGGVAERASDWAVGPKPTWDTVLNQLHVASGSHAGRSQNGADDDRRLLPGNLRLVPLEPIAKAGDAPDFGDITPPWLKGVWRDPESTGT